MTQKEIKIARLLNVSGLHQLYRFHLLTKNGMSPTAVAQLLGNRMVGTISNALTDLEKRLGVKLVERQGKRQRATALTPAGRALADAIAGFFDRDLPRGIAAASAANTTES